MGTVLNIETSNTVCSVALAVSGKLTAIAETEIDKSHSHLIMQFIDQVLKEAALKKDQINAIAISGGPGSYTGLRIGASVAKGLAYALNIPIIAISTLDTLIVAAKEKKPHFEGLFCPMIDARRMEVYCQLSNRSGHTILNPTNLILTEDAFLEHIKDNQMLYFGNGAEKATPVLVQSNYTYLEGIKFSAKYMTDLSYEKYMNQEFVNTVYYEPFYLKEFQAIKSKKNLLA